MCTCMVDVGSGNEIGGGGGSGVTGQLIRREGIVQDHCLVIYLVSSNSHPYLPVPV